MMQQQKEVELEGMYWLNLTPLNFYKVHPDKLEPHYFYWQRDFGDSSLLKGVNITVCTMITLSCQDAEHPGNEVTIYKCGLNEQKLLEMIKFIEAVQSIK